MSEKERVQVSQAQRRGVRVQVHQGALRTAETMKCRQQRMIPATQLAASS